MEFKEVINKRHSIREFEKKEVPRKTIRELIISATKAPSGRNEQPWVFYVVSKNEDLNKIKVILQNYVRQNKIRFDYKEKKIQKEAKNFYSNLGNPPSVIFVYRKIKRNPPAYQMFNDIAAISCAIENLMLSAVSKGLGTCWIGTFKAKEKEITKIVNAPKNQELMASIVIGYPKKGYVPLKREKKKLNEVLKFI